jgi:hypothetical protein
MPSFAIGVLFAQQIVGLPRVRSRSKDCEAVRDGRFGRPERSEGSRRGSSSFVKLRTARVAFDFVALLSSLRGCEIFDLDD